MFISSVVVVVGAVSLTLTSLMHNLILMFISLSLICIGLLIGVSCQFEQNHKNNELTKSLNEAFSRIYDLEVKVIVLNAKQGISYVHNIEHSCDEDNYCEMKEIEDNRTEV